MAKGNVSINITDKSYVYIDGGTGEELTQQEFNKRHNKGIRSFLGANRVAVESPEEEGGTKEA